MSIASRVEITLTCGSDDYFLEGGKDHRASLPTILKEVRKRVSEMVYCSDDEKPILHFWEEGFVHSLNELSLEGYPVAVEGSWEFPYVGVPCGGDYGYNPAETLSKLLAPEFLRIFMKCGVDRKAFQCEIKQWSLEVDPDDSSSLDFSDEDSLADVLDPDDYVLLDSSEAA